MWDALWQPFVHYAAELRVFLRAALAAYPAAGTRLIVRTLNAACCADAKNAEATDFSNAGRTALFNAELLRAVAEVLPPARVRVWDVFALGDARDPATAAGMRSSCGPPHEPAQDVLVENQVFLNGFCREV